jgi:polyisoprenoid-binding protein YceI
MRNALRAAVGVLALALILPVSARAETWVIDPAHTVSGHMMIANVTGVFEAKSVNTRIARRDDDLRSDNFFSGEKFPTLAFRSRRVQNVRAEGFDLVGDLTIRDATREVVLRVDGPTAPIKDPQGNRRVGATASTTINRRDFGIMWNRTVEAVERKS